LAPSDITLACSYKYVHYGIQKGTSPCEKPIIDETFQTSKLVYSEH